jgi:hypothetical protein
VAEDPAAQLERVAYGQAPPPRQAGPLTGLLTRMLHDDPAERPHMAEVAAALADIAAGEKLSSTDTLPAPSPTKAPSRRLLYAALGLLAIGLLALLTVLPLTSQDDPAAPPPTTSRGSTVASSAAPSSTVLNTPAGTPPPAAPPPQPGADTVQFQRVVTEYYALLSKDPGQAWALLGPAMQAQDRAAYESFWGQVKDLRISTPPRATGNTVVIEIEYTQAGRGRVQETHQHDIVSGDGAALINSDLALSSEAAKDGAQPSKKNGK